jgi:hypothetical protein
MPSHKVSMRASMSNQTTHFGIMGGLYNRKISGRSSMNRVTSRLEIPASAKEGYQYMKMHNLLSKNPLGSGGVGRMFSLRAGGSRLGSSGLGSSGLGSSGLGSSLDKRTTEQRVVVYVTSWGDDADGRAAWWTDTASIRQLGDAATHIMLAFGVNYPSTDDSNAPPLNGVVSCDSSTNLIKLLNSNFKPDAISTFKNNLGPDWVNGKKKLILSIGGAGMNNAWGTCIGTTPTERKKAAESFWELSKYIGAHGIDVDIEAEGISEIFIPYLVDIKRKEYSDMILTAAPMTSQIVDTSYTNVLSDYKNYLDFISLQLYNSNAIDVPGRGINAAAPEQKYAAQLPILFNKAKTAMGDPNKVVSLVCGAGINGSPGSVGCDWGCTAGTACSSGKATPNYRSDVSYGAQELICQYESDIDTNNGGFGYWSANLTTNAPITVGTRLAYELATAIKNKTTKCSAPPSPDTKYSCSSVGTCVAASNGTFTTSNCDNKCSAPPTKDCKSIAPQISDSWCRENCAHDPPNCPAIYCKCT